VEHYWACKPAAHASAALPCAFRAVASKGPGRLILQPTSVNGGEGRWCVAWLMSVHMNSKVAADCMQHFLYTVSGIFPPKRITWCALIDRHPWRPARRQSTTRTRGACGAGWSRPPRPHTCAPAPPARASTARQLLAAPRWSPPGASRACGTRWHWAWRSAVTQRPQSSRPHGAARARASIWRTAATLPGQARRRSGGAPGRDACARRATRPGCW